MYLETDPFRTVIHVYEVMVKVERKEGLRSRTMALLTTISDENQSQKTTTIIKTWTVVFVHSQGHNVSNLVSFSFARSPSSHPKCSKAPYFFSLIRSEICLQPVASLGAADATHGRPRIHPQLKSGVTDWSQCLKQILSLKRAQHPPTRGRSVSRAISFVSPVRVATRQNWLHYLDNLL